MRDMIPEAAVIIIAQGVHQVVVVDTILQAGKHGIVVDFLIEQVVIKRIIKILCLVPVAAVAQDREQGSAQTDIMLPFKQFAVRGDPGREVRGRDDILVVITNGKSLRPVVHYLMIEINHE